MIPISNHPSTTFRRAALAFAAVALLSGCAARTKLFDVWKDPDAPAGSLHKVLVLAVKRTPTSRRIWEDNFVVRLGEHGAQAAPSYRYFSEALPDTQQVADLVLKEAFDGVLVVNRAHVDTVGEEHAGTVTTTPVTVRDPWNGFYRTVYRDVYEPGYIEDVRVVTQEINVWFSKGEGRLVWSATAQTYDAQTSEKTSDDVVDAVVDELAKNGLLPSK